MIAAKNELYPKCDCINDIYAKYLLNLAAFQVLLLTASKSDKRVSSDKESPKPNLGAGFKANSALQRILLVEDNALNRQMLKDYLVFCGYEVLALAGGYGFFEELAYFQPHLILLDLRLPDIDGYILLEQLQESSQWRDSPVIVVSAFAFKADQQRALSLGARRYFVKPVNLSNLKQAIQEELRGLTD